MKKYKVLDTVMLSFIHNREQGDYLFKKEDGWTLECDGSTIWVQKGELRHESITMANAIDIWVGQGRIEELK